MRLSGKHYHVLRAPADQQFKICGKLSEVFPAEHGGVFVPQWEYYRRDKKGLALKPLFSVYIFVHTDLKRTELFEMLRKDKLPRPVRIYLMKTDSDNLWTEKVNQLFDMSEDEEEFFDAVLDRDGVERVSRGYIDGKSGRAVVMEDPLSNYSDRIVKLDKRNWLA